MRTNYSREDLIDLYLLDKLSAQERKDFEDQMLRKDELRKDVDVMRRIKIGFERKGETEAIDAMRTVSEEQLKSIIVNAENEHKPPVKKVWLYPAIAGMVAVIALLLYIGFQPKYQTEELYSSFYTPFVYEYTPSRGGILDRDQEHLLEQAIAEYNRGNYTKALVLFDSITINLNAVQVPEEVILYTALCMAQTGNENIALGKLESIASLNDAEFKHDAQWNLALLYLKLEEQDKCRKILRDITESEDNSYADEANKLLDKLNTKKWF